jgi:hypothetical protein
MAAEPLYSYSSRGVSAYADWSKCNNSGCWYVSLYAFQGTQKGAEGPFNGTRVCVFASGFSSGESYVTGCSQAPRGTLSVTKDLSSATLDSTSVGAHVCTYDYKTDEEVCDPNDTRMLTASASWTGFGSTYSDSWRYSFTDGSCKETDSGKGTAREATARGVVNDIVFRRRHLDYAGLGKGMERYRSTCEFIYG